ncbi:MAG: hypothetical protein ACWA6X_14400 [Bauldia sp.]
MRFTRLLSAGSLAALALVAAGAARADMAGQYTGYGEGAGTTIDLTQTGTALNGIIGGEVTGVLIGTATGDQATGVVLLFDVAKLPFTGVFTGTELRITLTGVNGQQTLVPFTLDGAPPPPIPTAPTKPAPQPAPAPAPTVLDHAAVTEALRTLLAGLVADEFDDATPEARAVLVECLIGVTAPLSAEELQMLVDTGFQPDDAMIVGFDRTVPGIDAAVGACFSAADGPPQMSTTLATGATVTVSGNGSQRFEPIDGGYRFFVGGLEIDVTAAGITMGGGTTPLPAMFGALAISVADDGSVTAVVDGMPLRLVTAVPPSPGPAPVPVKPAPAPAPTPAPAPAPVPSPVALDEATVNENLRTVLAGVVASELPDATEAQRTAVIACLMDAVAGLPVAERQHLADIGFDPDDGDVARLETLLPGVSAAVRDCLLGDEPPRTSVTLDNGATVTVEGGLNHVFEAIAGGYRIAVDTTDIVVTAQELVVSGSVMALPANFVALVVSITETGFTATVDGAPLTAN